MDIKSIKQIVEMMKRSDLTEFEIEEKELKLRICRQSVNTSAPPVAQVGAAPAYPVVQQSPVPAPSPQPVEANASGGGNGESEEEGVDYIKSPMVGTFYRATSPESDPFVEPGQKVSSDSVVCIIEAMKVMNEIQAERSGTVMEILVENGEPVEYNQPLFKVKSS